MENTASTGDPTTAVSNRGWFIPWLAIASVVVLTVGWSGDSALLRLIISREIATALSPACACGDLVDGYLCINGGGAFIGLVWQMKMANLAVAAMAPLVPCLPLLPWLPALHGENRVGHLVGMGRTPDF